MGSSNSILLFCLGGAGLVTVQRGFSLALLLSVGAVVLVVLCFAWGAGLLLFSGGLLSPAALGGCCPVGGSEEDISIFGGECQFNV